jgi:hypothetical protein
MPETVQSAAPERPAPGLLTVLCAELVKMSAQLDATIRKLDAMTELPR